MRNVYFEFHRKRRQIEAKTNKAETPRLPSSEKGVDHMAVVTI